MDATDLSGIKTDSIDLIYTDPPYSDIINYSELITMVIDIVQIVTERYMFTEDIIVYFIQNISARKQGEGS